MLFISRKWPIFNTIKINVGTSFFTKYIHNMYQKTSKPTLVMYLEWYTAYEGGLSRWKVYAFVMLSIHFVKILSSMMAAMKKLGDGFFSLLWKVFFDWLNCACVVWYHRGTIHEFWFLLAKNGKEAENPSISCQEFNKKYAYWIIKLKMCFG